MTARPKPSPASVPDACAEDDRKTEAALADARAGIGIPFEEVGAWVESWDTEDELPEPKARKLL
ncbi:MAG TPA: CopG family transcriptional regulator [Azospirillaceae bacterium]|nr:CopG family transcriptional regulator [Azospirillaceae bacterium]